MIKCDKCGITAKDRKEAVNSGWDSEMRDHGFWFHYCANCMELKSSIIALKWDGKFSIYDPDPNDDHGPIYLVCPGGLMVDFSCDPTPSLDISRVEWVVKILNEALTKASNDVK